MISGASFTSVTVTVTANSPLFDVSVASVATMVM